MEKLAVIHHNGYVHCDIRRSNLFFTENHNDAFLIDLDFCVRSGSPYPDGYAQSDDVPERYPGILKTCCVEHDRFSLAYLMKEDFDSEEISLMKYRIVTSLLMIQPLQGVKSG